MNFTNIDFGNIKDLVQAGATIVSTTIAIIALWRQWKQAERLKVLELELDKTKFEHQTKFIKLHEKRAEVIAELYRKIVILEIWAKNVVLETDLPDEAFTSIRGFAEDLSSVFDQISLNLQELAAYFNLNRLYLEESLCTKILYFHDVILEKDDPIFGFFNERLNQMPKEEILSIYGGNLRERAFGVLDCIADSRRAVENEFRQLLGIHRSGGSEEDTTQINDDLMWISTPESIDPIKRRKSPGESSS